VLLTLGLPGPPHRTLLLRDPDQHHLPVAALGCGGFDQRAGHRLFVLALGEAIHRDAVGLGEAIDLPHVGLTDASEGRRGRDLIPALPAQELAHPTHRLQLGYIGLQEDPVHRAAGERDVIPQ
jgi:hypothetical protein